MPLYDQHTHSLHSHETASISTVAEMCIGAMKNGMSGITITDHYDLGRRPVEQVTGFIRSSVADIAAVKEELADRFYLGMGIELGEGHTDTEESRLAMELGPFDVVLGSLHNVYGRRDFSYIGQEHPDKTALFHEYMAEQLQMAQWGGYDVVTHLTYPFRYYMLGEGAPDIRDFEEELRSLFRVLAEKGKALEVNVSGLYNPAHGLTMPGLWELKLFRECGGELVTVGSDAHDMHHAGMGIAQGAALLREAGFRYQALFKERKPCMVEL